MGLLSWIVIGLAAGFLAKLAMPSTEEEPSGLLGTMILGIVGAVVGGWLWNLVLNRTSASSVDLGSIFVAFLGSVIVISLLRLFSRQTSAY